MQFVLYRIGSFNPGHNILLFYLYDASVHLINDCMYCIALHFFFFFFGLLLERFESRRGNKIKQQQNVCNRRKWIGKRIFPRISTQVWMHSVQLFIYIDARLYVYIIYVCLLSFCPSSLFFFKHFATMFAFSLEVVKSWYIQILLSITKKNKKREKKRKMNSN